MQTDGELRIELERLKAELTAMRRERAADRTRATRLAFGCMLLTLLVSVGWNASAQNKAGDLYRVPAPFAVVDSAGKPIFVVKDDRALPAIQTASRGAYLVTASGATVASINAPGGTGGMVKVYSATSDTTTVAIAALGSSGDTLGMLVRREGQKQVYAGINAQGGAVHVFANGDAPRVGLQTESGRGAAIVWNAAKIPIAYLTESDKVAGTGNVTVADGAGAGVFSAGYTGSEGSACVNTKSGLWCMGKNLPLGK